MFSGKTLAWTSMIDQDSRQGYLGGRGAHGRTAPAHCDPSLAHLGPLLAAKAFVDDGYIGLGVPIGTDAFVQHFVKKSIRK
jgi:hypothetical protein